MVENKELQNIWIDCDVGSDDAFAILLATFSSEVNVLGISSTYGNSSLEHTTENTLRLLTAYNDKTTPVYKGMAKPYLRHPRSSPEVHGVTGLGGSKLLPKSTRAIEPLHAVPAMAHVFGSMPDDSISLLITGPTTNVALLLTLYPEIVKKLKQVVIMGGSIGMGNTTPTSEMNIVSDPESSEVIFSHPGLCGRIVLIPLETTHMAIATKAVMSGILKTDSNFRQLMHGLVSSFAEGYVKIFGFTDGPPVHDPLTVYYVLHPEAFQTKLVHVTVVQGGKSDGMTVCDMYGRTGEKPNVHVSVKTDSESFWKAMLNAIDLADAVSPIN